MNKKILSLVFILLALLSQQARAQSVDFQYPQDPSISRFQGFTGYVAPEIASKLDLSTIRVYINGEDRTSGLKIQRDPASGAVALNFQPQEPLPVGKIRVQVLVNTADGGEFSREFSYAVDPTFDPDLEKAVQALQQNPTSSRTHMDLGRLYEAKRLFRDAAYEYDRALHFNPDNEEARKAYNRIFAMWGEKSIEQDHVRVDVALDDSLYSMGGPVAFEVKVTNGGGSQITIDPKQSVFIDSEGHQVFPLDDPDAYVQAEMDERVISTDQYAQLSYFMENHPLDLMGSGTLHASTMVYGYLAFPRPAGNSHAFTFVFSGVDAGGKGISFRFPFLLP